MAGGLVWVGGPSPRVRGAAPAPASAGAALGAIPAGAGSRQRDLAGRDLMWGHPRRCGEQSPTNSTGSFREGPSPQVRGAGSVARSAARPAGAIPAGAGSSAANWSRRWRRGGHPRRCGEQDFPVRTVVAIWGPSPQVRGAAANGSASP
ncbi:conserved hypothetical protein [Streptomyces sp. F-3]|nr:conserved hypothetical protein [Streptomyces sp. F-3]